MTCDLAAPATALTLTDVCFSYPSTNSRRSRRQHGGTDAGDRKAGHTDAGDAEALATSSRGGVENVSFTAQAGRVLALLGPNGAGKSTTVALAVGLRRPHTGTIRIFGHDPLTAHDHTAAVTGVMLQDGGLPMAAKPLEILNHLAQFYRQPIPVAEIAARLGIQSFAQRSIRRLSGGQRQRVALAAALIGRPRLVFLDEPTAGLDPQARLVVHQIINELRADGVAVVLTTHDLDDAEQLADEVVIIDHGKIIAAGSPHNLLGGHGGHQRLRLVSEPAHTQTLHELFTSTAELAVWHPEVTDQAVVLSGEFSTGDVADIVSLCARRNIPLSDLRLSHPSLGDVFLDLTGRSLR